MRSNALLETIDRAHLLTGAGHGFCAGQDLADRVVGPGDEAIDLGDSVERYYGWSRSRYRPRLRYRSCGRKRQVHPIIRQPRPHSRLGRPLDSSPLVGQAPALGLAMTGEPLGSEKAEAWGLIWHCVNDDALDTEANISPSGLRLARRVAWSPPSTQSEAHGSNGPTSSSTSNVI